jgi:hypothetical protein
MNALKWAIKKKVILDFMAKPDGLKGHHPGMACPPEGRKRPAE